MNDRARDALAEASLRPDVIQIRGKFMGDVVNMVCGLEAIHLKEHNWDWGAARDCRNSSSVIRPFGVYACGWIQKNDLRPQECHEIIRHNDEDGWDFLTLSRKACLGSPQEQAEA